MSNSTLILLWFWLTVAVHAKQTRLFSGRECVIYWNILHLYLEPYQFERAREKKDVTAIKAGYYERVNGIFFFFVLYFVAGRILCFGASIFSIRTTLPVSQHYKSSTTNQRDQQQQIQSQLQCGATWPKVKVCVLLFEYFDDYDRQHSLGYARSDVLLIIVKILTLFYYISCAQAKHLLFTLKSPSFFLCVFGFVVVWFFFFSCCIALVYRFNFLIFD